MNVHPVSRNPTLYGGTGSASDFHILKGGEAYVVQPDTIEGQIITDIEPGGFISMVK